MRRPLIDAMLADAAVDALLSDESQLAAMLKVEIALAKAQAATGVIPERAAERIAAALQGFTADWDDLAQGMGQDGVVVPRLVAQMRNAVGSEHGAFVHMGATSQDVVDTALMLQLRSVFAHYANGAAELVRQLDGIVRDDGTKPLMAHTRMQAARPFTVAQKLRTWSEPLAQLRRELADARGLLAIQLGGPIGDRSGFDGKGDDIAARLAQELGLADAPSWQSTRSRIVTLAGLVAQLSGMLGKIGADVALMAQSEVAAIRLHGGGSSSSMAHKVNPVGAEALVALAHHNAILLGGVQLAMVHENERSGAAWTLEWLTLPQMLRNSGGALRVARTLLGSIRF